MKMRAGVWWCVAALAVLSSVTANALRPSQVTAAKRVGRRLSTLPVENEVTTHNWLDDVTSASTSLRSRTISKQEEVRPSTRKSYRRNPQSVESSTQAIDIQSERNERFQSRRTYSRTRSKPKVEEPDRREIVSVTRPRLRQDRRRVSTQSPLDISSPALDESKLEVISSNLDEITKIADDRPTTQFRRRNSVLSSTPKIAPRMRNRISTRTPSPSVPDLLSSGTTNTLSITEKDPIITNNLRKQKKLRFKTRPTETDTNLIGEGLSPAIEVTNSSQIKEITPSQSELQNSTSVVEADQSTEAVGSASTTVKITNRPLLRGTFKSSVVLKGKSSEEIKEDDNYPESFKALLIGKNASTQTSSPPRESLSVKATQHKEYNTKSNSLSAVHTAPETTQNRTRYRSFKVGSAENKFTGPSAPSAVNTFSVESQEKTLPKIIKGEPVESVTKKINNFRSRTVYARSRKTSSFSTTVKSISTSEDGATPKPLYRFNRKLKATTTNAPKFETTIAKRTQTTNLLKRTLPRSSYYARFKNSSKNGSSNILEDVITESNTTGSPSVKISLRPTFQNRIRSRSSSQEVEKPEHNETITQENIKPEDLSTAKIVTNVSQANETLEENKNRPKLFVLSINSNESDYSPDKQKDEVSENIEEVIKFIVSTPRYHSSFKDVSSVKVEDSTEQLITKRVPLITNLQGKKFDRRPKEKEQNLGESSTTKTSFTRFGEPFSRATKVETAPTNRVTPDFEKPKSRFSSKYRGSYTAEKPNYKPTVPSVTPSTAWLKFFVTDRDLTKTVQEPYWYDEVYNMSTEPGPYIIAATPIIHESSIELIEEEQNEIGPGLKYYSYTQSRSTLPSEDLRLSESPMKSSLIMNVEASNHSPSVTISIFDVLAEILTSTPRPQLSSTTDAVPKTNTKTDEKLILIGVSNNIDVNNVKIMQSPDSASNNADSTNAIARSVTPDVINTLSHGENTVTEKSDIKNTDNTTPFPKPTPVSARKPFAIKLLYANTYTSSESISTTSKPSTKMPQTEDPMVLKSVSDLFLLNNNLVSPELTSMLSNNINSILKSMNVETRSKITVNMEKLLRNIVPRALENGVPNIVDIIPMTTPYSLEEISDTEVKLDELNITGINANPDNETVDDLLQTVTTETSALFLSTNSFPFPYINANDSETNNLPTTSEVETTTNYDDQDSSTIAFESTDIIDEVNTLPPIVNISSVNENNSTSTSIPFSKSAQLDDIFTSSAIPVLYPQEINNFLDPPQVSPRELWVLSRKARLLKLIEDLLQEHKNELSSEIPPLDGLETLNNIPMSQRLTNILMNMTSKNSSNSIFLPSTSVPNPLTSSGSDSLSTPSYESTTTTASTPIFSSTTTDPVIARILQQLENEKDDIEDNLTTQYNMETTTEIASTLNSSPDVKIETTTTSEITLSTEPSTMTVSTTTQKLKKVKPPKRDYVIFGILPNNTVIRKNPNDDPLETLTETTPYVIYGVLPNNTIIRKFPNGTRIPRVMQKIDILPISPSSLRNPNSPIYNNPAIVRPQFLPVRESTNDLIPTEISNNGTETELTANTVNNQQIMIPSSALNITNSNVGVITTTNRPSAEKSTASHVLSLRTTTMLPSVDEILLNSISSAIKKEMVISSMTSSTHEPRILTLDIDPETKQIRTEKPDSRDGKSIFKFIPIDEIKVPQQNTNVFKLAKQATTSSTLANDNEAKIKSTTVMAKTDTLTTLPDTEPTVVVRATEYTTSQPTTTTSEITSEFITTEIATTTTTEPIITTTMEASTTTEPTTTSTTTEPSTTSTTTEPSTTSTTTEPTTTSTTTEPTTTTSTTTEATTTEPTTTTTTTTTTTSTTTTTTTTTKPTTTTPTTTTISPTTSVPTTLQSLTTNINQQDTLLLEALLQAGARNGKNLNISSKTNSISSSAKVQTNKSAKSSVEINSNLLQNFNLNDAKFIQTLLTAGDQKPTTPISRESTTVRSIEDDIKQFEEDAKFLKALLQATGQNPSNLNIPSLDSLIPQATTVKSLPTTTKQISTTQKISSDSEKLLQALLMATVQTNKNNVPIISKVTSNVRVSSMNTPIPNTVKSTQQISTTTKSPETTSAFTVSTFQPPSFIEDIRISTTKQSPNDVLDNNVLSGRRAPQRYLVTTETPKSSTFSVEEDFKFLQNLKSVLNANANADPETELANRIIALAVERSLNDITSANDPDIIHSGKANPSTTIKMTTTTTTTTPTTTTTTPKPTTTQIPTTTTQKSTPSIEEDIKQFQEDTKLLQALLKATGQDPSKFNLPTITSAKSNVRTHSSKHPMIPNIAAEDLTLLSNLLSSPSPLNEPFDPLTVKPLKPTFIATNRQKLQAPSKTTTTRAVTSTKSSDYGTKLNMRGNIKSTKNEEMLLQSLIKLQGVQEATTLSAKTITGQLSEQTTRTVPKSVKPILTSETTQAPMSTEYGKTNDALLAALLKEQGFGPTTANSLDEQLRLAALLNQVVVTPKSRRVTTTTPQPPPPPARRPVLDGLAWLWQTWRETAPGPGPARPNRRPASSPPASMTSSASTSNRVNWFGSGPFVGNAEPTSNSNRIPLDPPRAVSSDSSPNRGQLVSAAINVTRAFSQFLGAALQGAAQTVQNVIKAGQRAATDVYGNGSG